MPADRGCGRSRPLIPITEPQRRYLLTLAEQVSAKDLGADLTVAVRGTGIAPRRRRTVTAR
ncbi:hypothetical protein ACFWTE_03885 [Nocardiopsis sp. NPDC058631]|uniref:hypothetical protein n=1 Tax=Nocardiopsis sp. NPDC058631 TaxID=3346566 RepID=UPI0036482217